MTKVPIEGVGWISRVVGSLGSPTKIVNTQAGRHGQTQYELLALDMAINRPFLEGDRGQRLSLVRHHRCQPTSTALMRACGT